MIDPLLWQVVYITIKIVLATYKTIYDITLLRWLYVCLIKHSCTQASFINYKICNGMQRHKMKVSVVHDIHVVRRIQGLM